MVSAVPAFRTDSLESKKLADRRRRDTVYKIIFPLFLNPIHDLIESIIHQRGSGKYDYIRIIDKIFGAFATIPNFHSEFFPADNVLT